MKESAFRTAVLRHLPKSTHHQPMMAGMMGCAGTPDTYFDHASDLWVEWKVLRRDDHLPAVIPVASMPTTKQVEWLDRRFKAGGNAVVIVGVKLSGRVHGFVLDSPSKWRVSPMRAVYEPSLCTAADLAAYILRRIS